LKVSPHLVRFPTLTVEQTLRFASKARAPHQRLENQSRGNFVTGLTEVLTTIFGLSHAKKTPVGDAAIRGVSGGEKKRVSISEALAARNLIGAWDKYVVSRMISAPYMPLILSV